MGTNNSNAGVFLTLVHRYLAVGHLLVPDFDNDGQRGAYFQSELWHTVSEYSTVGNPPDILGSADLFVHKSSASNPKMNTEYYLTKYNPYRSRMVQQAASYARECYGADSSGLVECNTFVQRTLAAAINQNASCPFADSICKSTTGNIMLDSGLMNSHHDFGLNSPPDQRFQYRRVMQ